jgi:hypothetical protein
MKYKKHNFEYDENAECRVCQECGYIWGEVNKRQCGEMIDENSSYAENELEDENSSYAKMWKGEIIK